jgi:hypothetical protein
MMEIEVEHGDPLEAPVLHGVEGGAGGVVEEAEAKAHVLTGLRVIARVVAGRTARHERVDELTLRKQQASGSGHPSVLHKTQRSWPTSMTRSRAWSVRAKATLAASKVPWLPEVSVLLYEPGSADRFVTTLRARSVRASSAAQRTASAGT